ncbi:MULTISPECIES: glycosyltransferase family 4 protein [unclassified Synechocystis]|uniref:glycosyltransferase family 4 protein n=1 Tax=unclassified Synechocystis TaxID=2640012 RepID=UPI00040E2E73|nr:MULTISPECIES: glycosyltransferase family 4 protein [unclassified Synechocystis]AIE74686.1 glycosyl transferase, group 1 [Synechocystis sp. PCC 6714]MCT0253958.1 glycosyltransferase family 4 protein [Synechocystis sp. CS-94]
MSPSPLRILTVADTPCDPNSGAAGTVYYTNQALRQLGHEVDEIWADDLGPRRIAHGNLHSLLEQPRAYRHAVMKAVSKKKYDVVQMSQPQAYLAAKALKQSGFKGLVINRSHGVELRVDEVLPYWYKKLGIKESRFPTFVTATLRKLLQRQWHEVVKYCDGIIVGCQLDCDFLNSKFSLSNCHIIKIHHGVSDILFEVPINKGNKTTSSKNKILHVGQYAFFKGSEILIEIINNILNENRDLQFTWVCAQQNHNQIKSKISDSLSERVQLLDYRPIEKLVEVYDSHDIFLFPSFYEGFGKAPFEAMARGLCVVASDEGGMHDYIQSGVNGYLCEVGNVPEFVKTLRRIVTEVDNQNVENKAIIQSKSLSWKLSAIEMSNFYKSLFNS